jgi:hypothetical protein
LSIDKKAACIAMCACGQIDSPLFDPAKFPGMSPILSIKFCTVPVSAKDFSPGGTVVYSIEEVFKQLYGVVDALDKGGEVGVHEKQKEFLDSSIKGMNFGKMVTFTFSQAEKSSPPADTSEYMSKQVAKAEDTNIKQILGVSHPLEDPVSSSAYTLVQNRMNLVNTYATTYNYADEAKKVEVLQQTLTALSDVKETLRNEKDILIGTEIDVYLDQQRKFWNEVHMVLGQISNIAQVFFAENS